MVLMEMFVMASMIFIFKNSASSTSFSISSTLQTAKIFSSNSLISCIFSLSIFLIRSSRDFLFTSSGIASFSCKIVSDSSIIFDTSPLLAPRVARSRKISSSAISKGVSHDSLPLIGRHVVNLLKTRRRHTRKSIKLVYCS